MLPLNEVDLTGTIDLHIHTAPDVRPRKLDALEAARQASGRGMRAIMLKSHWTLTADRAALVEQALAHPTLRVFGGLALNEAVGGFNPAAVEAALQVGAKQIWMPTISAATHRHPPPLHGLALTDEGGHLRPQVHEIIRLIAAHDAILGTGHLSTPEIMQLVPVARAAGVRQLVITHPEHPPVEMPVVLQEELRDRYQVLFERSLITTMTGFDHHPLPFAELAATIRRVGYESTLLSTDFGQPQNPYPVDGLASYIAQLSAAGFDAAAIHRMACANPAGLLNLPA